MTSSTENRFSFDDVETKPSFDGLPSFPDLNSITKHAGQADEETGDTDQAASPGRTAGTEDSEATDSKPDGTDESVDVKGENAANVTNDNNDTEPTPCTNDTNDNDDEPTVPASSSVDLKGIRQGYLPSDVLELLPELLAQPARRISERRKRDVFLTGALPVWAGVLSNVRFRYGGSNLSPNLYSTVIAPPASGKSAIRHARSFASPLSEEISARDSVMGAVEQDTSGTEEPDKQNSSSRRFFLAADSSAAAIKESLAESPHGVICETEFRTLSQALESSWGKFVDVLLKGFQNETIKMNRSSKGTVTISHPAPSIALAGTPVTFDGVISGTSDGLFSRFLFYRFNREFEWTPQFGQNGTGLDTILERAAQDFQVGYHQLRDLEKPLRITIPQRLQNVHGQTFQALTEKWRNEENMSRSLQASLTRSGLQAVKIAVVLRGIRLIGSGKPLAELESAELRPEDMEAGLRLALTYLLHGVRVETRFREDSDPRASLTERKKRYLEALPEDRFSTAEAKQLAPQFNLSARNAQRWLKNWREMGLLTKPKRGMWAKINSEFEGIPGARSVISVINDIPALTATNT